MVVPNDHETLLWTHIVNNGRIDLADYLRLVYILVF
jgi:hypothetical protein